MFGRKRVYASYNPGGYMGPEVSVVERPLKRARTFQGRRRAGMKYATSFNPKLSAKIPLNSQLNQIRKAIRQTAPEIKYNDVTTSSANVTTAGSIVYATQIAQGDTLGTRDGEGVRLKTFDLKGSIIMPTDAATAVGYSRVFVVRDKQNASASPASASVVFDYVTDPTLTRLSLDTLGRFDVMWASPVLDHRRLVGDSGNEFAPTQASVFEYSWKGDIELRYFGPNSTDLEKNPIYVVYVTSYAGSTIDFVSNVRLGFTDS